MALFTAASTTRFSSTKQRSVHFNSIDGPIPTHSTRANFPQKRAIAMSMNLTVKASFTKGGDIGRLRDKRGVGSGDSYRVLLIDDARHSERLVAKVLPQAVPSVTPDDARKLFHESRVAVVIVTVKEHAEFYSQMMVRSGLRSIIEPESNSV
ncbi:hypothetical protein NC653_025055 [Populus alba x Populus x berolinensis]|uniref:Adaptor protein ClpS core domain-containing protein n=1 Tax=Populus alba x Populus x berolinensis TaxID=444605 RepID=A0AAD6Q7A4_9ROSI|nr:hypothetical protein NC653_025055 [Populus alba x Populus x berolinensis]